MFQGEDKVWVHYVNDIMATEIGSALFLSNFMRYTVSTQHHTSFLEVVNLRKNKILRTREKIRKQLRTNGNAPFVFFLGKN